MTTPRIPKLNEEFDPKLFRYILVKKLPIIFFIFFSFLLVSYLILRYTKPIYEAKTVIQIESESKAEKILDVQRFSTEQIYQRLELLRSRVFVERVLSKLSLDVRYFNEGKFLNHELYTASPFTINYVIYNPAVYGVKFRIAFLNDSLFKLNFSYNEGGKEVNRETLMIPGKWVELDELDIVMHLKSNGYLKEFERQKSFLFDIIMKDELYEMYISKISLIVLNEIARTIQVSVRDNNPYRASDIANAMASEFQLYDIERKSMSANNILDFIDSQLQSVFDDMTMYEDSITIFRKKYNINDVDELKRQSSINQLNVVETELLRVQTESLILKNILDELSKKEIPDALLLITILSGSKYQSQLQSDISKLSELLKKKEQMLLTTPENSSFIQSVTQQIDAQKNLIIKIVQNIKLTNDIILQDLTERYNSQYGQAYYSGYKPMIDLKRFERLYMITEQFYNQLIEKKTEFSILKAGYVPENIILETAYKMGYHVYPSKKKILMVAFVMAFLLSFVIVAFRYFRFDAIVSVSEVGKYTSVPILGVLPRYASDIPLHKFIVEQYPKSILAESFRAVRSNLQFINNTPGPKVIAVTSTISGEGKTFISVNLAGALAITGKRVIIIDSDMRNPTVHKYFHLSNRTGLSTILSMQSSVEDAIQDIGKYGIKFITAGPIPPNPAELLNDEKFDQLIAQLKEDFDFIIIDNPPIGLVSDALKSMQMADYPIYVLKANYSKRNFLPLTEKMQTTYNIHSISIVLNGYDKSISNVDMEKDLVYSYGYMKDNKKALQNNYYEQDEKPKYTLIQKIIRLLKRSFE